LECAETDLREVVALSKGNEDKEQVDKVEVDNEIEEWDAAIDEEDA
jgi:hypothetical protein